MSSDPLITNDAVVLGLLLAVLAAVFATARSERPFWRRFYGVVPSVLLCYFLPSLLATAGIISGERSQLYFVASRYLLPAALALLTISVDLPAILRLGPKALTMFVTGTVGIVVGGPIALLIVGTVSPETVGGTGPDAVWRGLTTVAGSWIGGSANQTSMKEVFDVSDSLFSAMIAVDVIVANLWMAVLLVLMARAPQLDARMGADTRAIDELRQKVERYQAQHSRIPALADTMMVLAVGFGITAFGHAVADIVSPAIAAAAPWLEVYSLTSPFFWLVVTVTTVSLLLSTTRLRQLEGVGASRIGSACLYVLIAAVGMRMNLRAIFENPGLFAVGGVWMLLHAGLMLGVARLIRAPIFFMAVGSQANVGGAASAPIVAAAMHPSLAPVGVLLAVLGYALGTYGAYICGQMMRVIAG